MYLKVIYAGGAGMDIKTTDSITHDSLCDEWSDGKTCYCIMIAAVRFDERQRAVARVESLTWQAMTWHNISKAILNRSTVKIRGHKHDER